MSPARAAGRGRRPVAALFGIACHGSFVVAVLAMGLGLATGMRSGQGRLTGAPALLADALLLVQFPALHSLLLSRPGRRLLGAAAPAGFGSVLAPTTFALVAGLQIGATFVLWSPSGVVLWQPGGAALALHWAAFAGAWIFLVKALADAGLGLQTGWIGWTALWKGTRPVYPDLPERGTFALCRQPIYLGFSLVLWSGPSWTPDHLAVAIAWSLYCVVGPLHKERRFLAVHGDRFRAYRARVPYLLPRRLFPGSFA